MQTLLTTKAETKPGEDAWNENAIHSMHYFFYNSDDYSHALLMGSVSSIDAKNQYTIRVDMDEGTLNNVLFPRPKNTCSVYVILNLPAGTVIPDDTSLDSIKSIALSASFNSVEKQDDFVMQGMGTAKIDNRAIAQAASGTIYVDRVAAKFTIGMIVPERYYLKDDEGVVRETWIPQPTGLKIEFKHAKSTATVGSELQPVGSNQFDYGERRFTQGTLAGLNDGETAWACNAPFYTYPESWTLGQDEAPYLKVTLPWAKDNGDGTYTYQNCYYKVLLSGTSIEANNWYNINVRLGMLGSFSDDEEDKIVINEDMKDEEYIVYFVYDWREALSDAGTMLNIVEAEIKGAQYLVVPVTSYTLYNQDQVKIPYSSSDDCEIVNVKATYTDFSGATPVEKTVANTTGWVTISDSGDIVFNHALNNDMASKKYDVAPYDVSFTVRHISAVDPTHVYTENVTIKQYPAITISHRESTTKSYDRSKGEYTGYVFVNNGKNLTNLGDNSGTSVDGSSNNANRNLYVISTSVLPEGSPYILGDPRLKSIDNLDWTANGVSGWASAPSVYGTSPRRLSYYYRTGNTSEYANVIAPKFRIASSYGATQPENYENANRRCASYQEDGYPAGRWRLPTKAEIEYIAQLNVDGYIPRLLGQATGSTAYWCGTGYVTVTPSSGTQVYTAGTGGTTTRYIRCVYDEWYWENSSKATVDKNTFTWGDMPRENFN